MNKLRYCLLITLFSLLWGTFAYATPILSPTGGTPEGTRLHRDNNVGTVINNYMNAIGLPFVDGTMGADVELDAIGDVVLTFTYLYKEAGYNNLFVVGGNTVFSTRSNIYGDTYRITLSGLTAKTTPLFGFIANGSSAPENQVFNGSNRPFDFGVDESGVNFFVRSIDDSAVELWFDDQEFKGDDDNHDDMVVRMSAAPVPEPATMFLIGTGLIGLACAGRRRFR